VALLSLAVKTASRARVRACGVRGGGCGLMRGMGPGGLYLRGRGEGPRRAGLRVVRMRRATAELGHESEPSSSLRMGPTGGSYLAAREGGEKRGGGSLAGRGWGAWKKMRRGRPAWAGLHGKKKGEGERERIGPGQREREEEGKRKKVF
jgi:hypothetical protein